MREVIDEYLVDSGGGSEPVLRVFLEQRMNDVRQRSGNPRIQQPDIFNFFLADLVENRHGSGRGEGGPTRGHEIHDAT